MSSSIITGIQPPKT
ncbi:unnamed protein product, partial [Onchocerca ochengi]|uniref:Uncharacterized protein n=1 Tax=Onchocerca ochengi TaxID=42157 RepID=A0A182F0I3_ONCOC